MSSNSSDSESDLPYPAPLDRNDFLQPGFSAASYLSKLHNRHQNLEDLQSDLRSRSTLLSKELLDVVNSNYQDFIELGLGLSGSENKVEEARLDVMGFRREVENMKSRVVGEESQINSLIQERVRIKKDIDMGRKMLNLESRVGELERQLMIKSKEAKSDEREIPYDDGSYIGSDENEEDSMPTLSQTMLRRNVKNYLLAKQIMKHNDMDHPFVAAQNTRMSKIAEVLRLDLSMALKRLNSEKSPDADRILNIIGLFREMGEANEAIRTLKLLPR